MIPTAEEILMGIVPVSSKHMGLMCSCVDAKKAMIEFAKLHVEAALTIASEEVKVEIIEVLKLYHVNEDSILNAYHLENIK